MSAASSRRKLLARRFAETMAFGAVGAAVLGLAGGGGGLGVAEHLGDQLGDRHVPLHHADGDDRGVLAGVEDALKRWRRLPSFWTGIANWVGG